ncbi:MAG: TetR/AcrR family transcriptional regulator [Spirochaetales bacterium]|nr:TetR/AcrR family transcriptional regulator [Spirochaetales bacterium]
MSPRGEKLNENMRQEAIAKITKAALLVFADYGYQSTTMNHIMQVSGLSKGLVYHYFPSKEKVFFHLVETALEISKRTWNEALNSTGTAWEKIKRLTEYLVRSSFTEENFLYSCIILQAMTQSKSVPGLLEFIGMNGKHYQLFPPLIVEAQQAGDIEQGDPGVIISAYFAMFHGYTLLMLHDKGLRDKITPGIFLKVFGNK